MKNWRGLCGYNRTALIRPVCPEGHADYEWLNGTDNSKRRIEHAEKLINIIILNSRMVVGAKRKSPVWARVSHNYPPIIVRVKQEVAAYSGVWHSRAHTYTHRKKETDLLGYDVGTFAWNSTALTPTPRTRTAHFCYLATLYNIHHLHLSWMQQIWCYAPRFVSLVNHTALWWPQESLKRVTNCRSPAINRNYTIRCVHTPIFY